MYIYVYIYIGCRVLDPVCTDLPHFVWDPGLLVQLPKSKTGAVGLPGSFIKSLCIR